MSCVVCGDRRECLACVAGGRIRVLVDTDPAYREAVAKRWREAPHRGDVHPGPVLPAAEQARLAVLVNRCGVREPIRCGCADRRAVCKLDPETPVERTHDECVACVRRRSPA